LSQQKISFLTNLNPETLSLVNLNFRILPFKTTEILEIMHWF